MQVKEKIIYSSIIFLVIIAAVFILFSMFNLYKTLAQNWGIGNSMSDAPGYYASCQKFKNNYEIGVNINTYNKGINNVVLELVSNGGMTSDKEKIEIPFVSQNSSDIGIFTLTGEPTKSSVIRTTYVMKGFWGQKNYSSIITPGPDCSTVDNPEFMPKPY
jgi:hypothetical protein